MSFWFAIVAIVAIASFSKVMRARYNAQHLIQAFRPDTGETEALAREVAALNKRIAVLERIITENRSTITLADEIEALRER